MGLLVFAVKPWKDFTICTAKALFIVILSLIMFSWEMMGPSKSLILAFVPMYKPTKRDSLWWVHPIGWLRRSSLGNPTVRRLTFGLWASWPLSAKKALLHI